MILDTSFIIDLLQGRVPTVSKIKKMEAESIATSISTPSIFKLFVGISLTKKPISEKNRIMEILKSWGIMDLDAESAALAGKIYGELIKNGEIIDPEGSMIAGIVISNNEPILTKNVKHFQRIPGLNIEEY